MERTEGTTIWLVSDGSYSDYHVLGIYSTHELAVAAKEAHNAYNEIEEWELDQIPPGPPGLFYWPCGDGSSRKFDFSEARVKCPGHSVFVCVGALSR